MAKVPSRYVSLSRRITAGMLALAVIPLFALGLFIQKEFSLSYDNQLESTLRMVTASKRDAIEMYLHERICQLSSLARTLTLSELSNPSRLGEVLNAVNACSGSYIDLGVIDQDGNHLAYVGPYRLKNVNYHNEIWFQQTLLKGEYISDVFLGHRNYPHFVIAVVRREGDKLWILRATIDSEVFNTLVKTVRFGLNGDSYLINKDMLLQTPSRFGLGVMAKADIPELPATGEEVRLVRWTKDGSPMMAGITEVEDTGWVLVVGLDMSEGVSPILKSQPLVIALIAAVALVIFIGTLLMGRLLVAKLISSERERAALDANLQQTNKMASLGKLAAGIAHEVNNPLTIIGQAAGWIRDILADGSLEDSPAHDELAEALDDIERHVGRAKEVTHRMLGFARRMEPCQENVDINALTEQTAKFLENESLHRNIELGFELDPRLPHAATDAGQIQQVILNLLENALDAVGSDGKVSVRTWSEGDRINLSVSDSGPGIGPENIGKVFDPFFTTKDPGEGTGLGLSIVYSTVKRLGGDISVESPPGQGAIFTVRLPLDSRLARSEEEI